MLVYQVILRMQMTFLHAFYDPIRLAIQAGKSGPRWGFTASISAWCTRRLPPTTLPVFIN